MKQEVLRKLSMARACFSLFRIKTAEGLQYRIAGLAGASIGVFWALIEITVYTVFYRYAGNSSAGNRAGLSLQQVISYVWLGQILFILQPMSIDGEIQQKIDNGDVGIELCRPMDLYLHWFAKIAAGRLSPVLTRGLITLIVALCMPSSYRLSPPASAAGLICMLVSTVSAFLLCTAYGTLVCTIRLNLTWGNGPTHMIMLIGGVLSGNYLPLQLWPDFMQKLLFLQPFAGYLDIPLRLYLGVLPPDKVFYAVGLQLFWIVIFIISGKCILHSRMKKIIIQGG